jgi:hypothetical protein
MKVRQQPGLQLPFHKRKIREKWKLSPDCPLHNIISLKESTNNRSCISMSLSLRKEEMHEPLMVDQKIFPVIPAYVIS